MITSTAYLYAAYLFVIVTLTAVTVFYIWRNICLARKIPHPHNKPLNLWRLLPFLSFAALIAIIFIHLTTSRQQEGTFSSDIMVGQPAPTIKLPLLVAQNDAPLFTTQDLIGQVTIVNFWASWCAPCRLEHPLLMQLAQDKRFHLIGINYKEAPDNALAFLHQFGNPFMLVATDRRGRAAIEWGVLGAPETYLIDRQGMITYRHIGPLTADVVERELLPAITTAASQ